MRELRRSATLCRHHLKLARRGSRLLTFFICILLCHFLACTLNAETKNRPYRVGVVLALSGELANFGRFVRQGIDLSLQHLSEYDRELIDLKWQDDQFKPAETVTAYRAMMASGGLDALLYLGSGPGHAVVPLAEKDGVLSIGIGASDGAIVRGRSKSFLHWITPEDEARAVVAEISKRGYRRLAIVAHEKEGPQSIVRALVDGVNSVGVGISRIVFEEALPVESKDFRSLVMRLKRARPDAIFTLLFPGSVAPFVRQVRDLGLESHLCSVESFEDRDEVKAAGDALNGAWYVTGLTGSDEFVGMFRSKYGSDPAWAAGNAYDAVQILVSGIKQFGGDNARIADYIRTLSGYSGALGQYSADGQNRFSLPAAVKIVGD